MYGCDMKCLMMKGGCWGHLFELVSTPSLARGFKLVKKIYRKGDRPKWCQFRKLVISF